MEKLIWLKGNQGGRRLVLRTTDETRRTVSEILIENGQGRDPDEVLNCLKIDSQLVRIMNPAWSFGCHEFKFPMTVPHNRVLVPNELEHFIREWCVRGFEGVVARRDIRRALAPNGR